MNHSDASRTAEYMALFRAMESGAPSERRLFVDPYARGFLRPALRAVAWSARFRLPAALIARVIDARWPGARTSGIARTRAIDDLCREALRDHVEQVVILGAGYDARAYRLPEMGRVPVFEVDHPATLAAKQRRLRAMGVATPENVTYVAVDFNVDALDAILLARGFDPSRRTLFLWEGVTNYLTAEAVDAMFRFLRNAAPGSRVIFTYIDSDVLAHPDAFPDTKALARTLSDAGEAWTFGFDPGELAAYLREHGLTLLSDSDSVAYRARYLGQDARLLRGYTFYYVAVAEVGSQVDGGASAATPAGTSTNVERR